MKLRLQHNSLRLRLTRSEVAKFHELGRIEETIVFGTEASSKLIYVLAWSGAQPELEVRADSGMLHVVVPADVAQRWSTTEQVGISAEVNLGDSGTLSVLVEKDFACLDRGNEENADTFPNPLAAHRC